MNFNNWNDIEIGRDLLGYKFLGKTFFYFDKKHDRLYAKQFSWIERIRRFVFGYQSQFNKNNLWDFFKSYRWVNQDEACPSAKVMRKIAGQKLRQFCEMKRKLFEPNADESALIQLFEKGLEINYENPKHKGYTALHAAIEHNRPRLTQYLIDRGADVNQLSWGKLSPLHLAVGGRSKAKDFKANQDMITELLDRGANINARDSAGKTALFSAVNKNDCDAARLLLN